jgi:predicted Zn-dependent peptidase
MVAFYSGPLSAVRAINVISKHFSSLSGNDFTHRQEIISDVKQFDITRQIDTHQAHTIIGAKLPGLFSEQRHAIALLTNILGGPGMNSLLNVALRERRGLVYSVEATTTLLTDCGLMTIYFGCDPEDTKKCSDIVYNTLTDIANGSLNDRAIERAKKQYLGQLAIAFENRENTTLNVARATLLRGAAVAPADTIKAIQAINSNDIRQVAASLIHSSSLTLSPNCDK